MISNIDKAIYEKLISLGYDVYDILSWNDIDTYPRIFIGDNNVTQIINKQKLAIEVVTTLHAFSNYDGTYEIKNIADDMIANIDHTLNIDGYNVSSCLINSLNIQNEDENIAHLILSFRWNIIKI